MVQTHEPTATAVPGALHRGYVEADGFRIRYREAGQGEPLVPARCRWYEALSLP